MDVTKPYKFIRFGAMDATKPYKFIGFGAMDATKPYKFIRFGAMDATKPYEFIGFGSLPGALLAMSGPTSLPQAGSCHTGSRARRLRRARDGRAPQTMF